MIKEANISYTPEKIDEFIEQITKEIESAKNIFQTALNRVKGMTIDEIVENTSAAEAYRDKITNAVEALNKKHSMYFNIVDMYEVGEMPDSVNSLWKLTGELDDYYSDLSKVEDVLDNIITAASKLTNFYSKQ